MTIPTVQKWIATSNKIVVLTGAGISTDSGIPDFRGPKGLWTKNPAAERMSDIRYYVADREVRKAAWQARIELAAWKAKPSWYLVAASESPDPRRWLAYAQDRKAEDPRYSISEFRREIQQAVRADGSTIDAPTPRDVAMVAPPINWTCPWMKPYCTRSGLPVAAEECRCEA